MSSLDARVDALFQDMPTDPNERLDAVAQLYAAIRERAAKHLEPAVREILQASDRLDYEQKLGVSRKINHVLQDAKLAIVDPMTDVPSALIANRPRPHSEMSRFLLRDQRSGRDGKRHTTHLKEPDTFSHLELVSTSRSDDDTPRQR
jgi:hypothetical protein